MNGITGSRILVIDDDRMFCHVLRSYLEEIGLKASVIHSGNGLLKKIEEGYDLLLLDLYMVGETGVDILISVKESHPELPVIIMTGYSSNEMKQTTANLGACAYLDKPFQMSALKEKITELLA